MPIHELAALAAAASWALTGIVSTAPSRALGAMGFVRLRMGIVFVGLALAATVLGGWASLTAPMVLPILLSGAIGIFVGDTALFATMNRLGPRATGLLFAANAPIAAVLGWVVLGETLVALALGGIALSFAGVLLAVAYGRRSHDGGNWLEAVRGPLWVGVALGLLAAAAQAVGTLLARPVMAAGADPIAVSALRCLIAAAALQGLALGVPAARLAAPLTWRLVGIVALSGFLAMGVGMTLLLFALEDGKVGIVSTLSATTPVMILPLLWYATGRSPAPAAWVGAALTVAGAALIFAR